MITVDTEIPLYIHPDLYGCCSGMTSYSILHNGCYPTGFSLLVIFCWPWHTITVLLVIPPYGKTFYTFVNRSMHAPSAILIPTLSRDPLAIRSNTLKLKVLYNGKFLQCVAEVSLAEECLSYNELHVPWYSAEWSFMISASFSESSITGSWVRGLLRSWKGSKGIPIVSAPFWEGSGLHSNIIWWRSVWMVISICLHHLSTN